MTSPGGLYVTWDEPLQKPTSSPHHDGHEHEHPVDEIRRSPAPGVGGGLKMPPQSRTRHEIDNAPAFDHDPITQVATPAAVLSSNDVAVDIPAPSSPAAPVREQPPSETVPVGSDSDSVPATVDNHHTRSQEHESLEATSDRPIVPLASSGTEIDAFPGGAGDAEGGSSVASPEPATNTPGNDPAGEGAERGPGELEVADRPLPEPRQSVRPFRPAASGLMDPSIIRTRKLVQAQRPTTGLRGAIYRVSNGRVNLGKPAAEVEHADLIARINRPLNPVLGAHHLAITSLKGGVGKTTVGACLGLTLAEIRNDRVASVDINLHAGTLHDRLLGTEQPAATIQHLLDNLDDIDGINDILRFAAFAKRLAVFAGDNDPDIGEAFAGDDYDQLIGVLNRFFNIILADCGTGLADPAMRATLNHTDSLIVVATPSIDAASRAGHTLDWLSHIGYGDLVDTAIVVLSHDNTSTEVDASTLRRHLEDRCASVIEIPYDNHLSAGACIDLDCIAPHTRTAYLKLAAQVANQF